MATPNEITRKRFSFTPPVSPLKLDPPDEAKPAKMMPFVIGVAGGSASGKVRKGLANFVKINFF